MPGEKRASTEMSFQELCKELTSWRMKSRYSFQAWDLPLGKGLMELHGSHK